MIEGCLIPSLCALDLSWRIMWSNIKQPMLNFFFEPIIYNREAKVLFMIVLCVPGSQLKSLILCRMENLVVKIDVDKFSFLTNMSTYPL